METATDIEVRQATIDDLAAIFHLGEKVFTPQAVTNLYRTWDEYEVTGLFNSEPEFMLVAVLDGAIMGFALGTVIEKKRTAWNYGHLLWLAVDGDCGRMGVGSRLFDRFREVMAEQGVRMMMIDTQADNDVAISFFTQKGFDNPTDHVYMTLNIDRDNT